MGGGSFWNRNGGFRVEVGGELRVDRDSGLKGYLFELEEIQTCIFYFILVFPFYRITRVKERRICFEITCKIS